MIDKLIEGKLITLLVGSVFRLVEILVRTIHLSVRGLRLVVQETLTSRLDRRISVLGKRWVAGRASVDPASIVIIERDGEYTGDPKYIAEEILRRDTGRQITWVLRDQSVGPFPREFRFVRYGTAAFYRAVAAASVVVHDGRALTDSGAVRRPDQHWLRVGTGGLTVPEDGTDAAQRVGSHPRNDVLVDTSAETVTTVRKKVLDRLGIADSGQRFLLYAPTRRATRAPGGLSGIDLRSVRAALSARFGGSWEILVRTHARHRAESGPLVAGLPAYCRDASPYPDLQELLVLSDAGMSDGDDWIFDYLLTRRPAFVFAAGSDHLVDGLEARPLPVITSQQRLLSAIATFDEEAHVDTSGQVLARLGNADDGRASARVVDQIQEWMSG